MGDIFFGNKRTLNFMITEIVNISDHINKELVDISDHIHRDNRYF